jgi:hypothetical protein
VEAPAPQVSSSRRRRLSSDGRMREGRGFWEGAGAVVPKEEDEKSAHSAARKAGTLQESGTGVGATRTTAGQSE